MSLLPVPAPIYLADANSGIVPEKYISMKRIQACACCGRQHEWCELYAWSFIKNQNGRFVENLRRVDWPKYRIPIEQWEDKKCTILPWCHDCNEPSLMQSRDLVDPPTESQVVVSSHQDPKLIAEASRIDRIMSGGQVQVRKVPAGSSNSATQPKSKTKSPKGSIDILEDLLK